MSHERSVNAAPDNASAWRRIVSLLGVSAALCVAGPAQAQSLSFLTAAGNAGRGSKDAVGTNAFFYHPQSVALDVNSNLYVADFGNNTIRKVTTDGTVTTFAGLTGSARSSDGTGTGAYFNGPASVATDSAGNIYVADSGNNTIRKITTGGVVTTLAGSSILSGSTDSTGTNALFLQPLGVALDTSNFVYVADYGNHTIRKVSPAGVVTTLAGTAGTSGSADGTGSSALFYQPEGVALDTANNIYVADTGNNAIRKITPAGAVTTLAGSSIALGNQDGNGTNAWFSQPRALTVNAGIIYVADFLNNTVRKVTAAGVVTTLAGAAGVSGSIDGANITARFRGPQGICANNTGIYVADFFNNTIRLVSPTGTNSPTTTVAGAVSKSALNGVATSARFSGPQGIVAAPGGIIYVADTENQVIRRINSGGVSILAGLTNVSGSVDGSGSVAQFSAPHGLALDSFGNIFVADTGNHTIRKVTSAGTVTTFAGTAGYPNSINGTGTNSTFNAPQGVAVDSANNVYVADTGNHVIRKITSGGVATTFAGVAGTIGSMDGSTTNAQFFWPIAIAVDASGNLYVTEEFNHTIRKITPAGVVSTLSGLAGLWGNVDDTNVVARYFQPSGLTVDAAGNIYVADSGNNIIRQLTYAGGNWTSTTVAGLTGVAGSTDGTGTSARFNYPTAMALDSSGLLYVADTGNNTIRVTGSTVYYPPSINIPPASLAVLAGSNVTFNVSATGTSPLTYQWAKNGANISNATNSSYYIANAQAAATGSYTVVVSNLAGVVTSDPATLAVSTPPNINPSPVSQSINVGSPVSFSVGVTGTAPFAYQWLKNGSTIAGQTLSSYSIASAQVGDAASYSVVVTNAVGSATSGSAVLTVVGGTAPSITSNPQSKATIAGSTVNFTVGASGTATLLYFWQKNGAPVSDGATYTGSSTAALTIGNVQAANIGSYSVIVSNSFGSATSSIATLLFGQSAVLTNVTKLNGSFRFQMLGTAGGSYNLESSTDLVHWSSITTLNGPATNYSDTSVTTNIGARVYRLKLNP